MKVLEYIEIFSPKPTGVTEGTRQGRPMSVLLFVICNETIAIAIRNI